MNSGDDDKDRLSDRTTNTTTTYPFPTGELDPIHNMIYRVLVSIPSQASPVYTS